MAELRYDLVVIGAGSAGLTAAEFGAQLGLRVALVEKGRIGGDCTWTGCVPSKALLKSAKVAQEMRTAGRYGLNSVDSTVDLAAVMASVHRAIDEVYRKESPEVLAGKGIDVILKTARFIDGSTLTLGDGQDTLKARRFIIATGAKPSVPPIQGLESTAYLTYETVWNLKELPARLIVLGAGPIGCELAQAFGRLGSKVTLLEAAPKILFNDEPEAAEVLSCRLTQEGVDLRVNTPAQRVWQDDLAIHVGLADGEVVGDALLLAAGRTPNISSLDLTAAGLAHDAKGIRVDNRLRTSQKRVYAAGDCVGGYQFTHYAGWQGFMAVRNAFMPGPGVKAVLDYVPWVTFTDPEVAHVGLTEAQARERHGSKVRLSRWSMEDVDRAVAERDVSGLIKVVHRPSGEVLGATIVSGRAGEMVHEWALAIGKGLKLRDLAEFIHVYPTYSMANMQLAAKARVAEALQGNSGRLLRGLTKLAR